MDDSVMGGSMDDTVMEDLWIAQCYGGSVDCTVMGGSVDYTVMGGSVDDTVL